MKLAKYIGESWLNVRAGLEAIYSNVVLLNLHALKQCSVAKPA